MSHNDPDTSGMSTANGAGTLLRLDPGIEDRADDDPLGQESPDLNLADCAPHTLYIRSCCFRIWVTRLGAYRRASRRVLPYSAQTHARRLEYLRTPGLPYRHYDQPIVPSG